ncbi:MAG: ATP-binding protein [Syntrophomonas sp.]|nr:ATP-binding protein [Syntrophomonas sp.]
MNAKKSISSKAFLLPKSLRLQLLSRSLLILAGLLVLVGLLQYVFMQEVIYKNKAESLQSQIMSFPAEAFTQISPDLKNGTRALPRIFIPEASIAFIDVQGNYSVLANGPDNIKTVQLDMQEYMSVINIQRVQADTIKKGRPGKPYKPELNFKIIDNGGIEQLIVLQPVISIPEHNTLGLVQISVLTAPLKKLLLRQLFIYFIISLAALLLGLLAFLPVLNKTLIPLSNMVDTAGQIDAGNLDRRFPTNQGQSEIDRLTESFNSMLERLETSFATEKETQEQMRRFIAVASHELRTPLTSIRGFVEILLRGAVNQPGQLDKSLKSMHSESLRLNKLVNDLLLLSKLDRQSKLEIKKGPLDKLILEMEPQLRILAGNRKISFSIEPDVKCKFDQDQMKQVVLNLFHNAVQYTDPKNGHIQVIVKKDGSGVQLSVKDNGVGISDAHLPHVFDRFYRSDSSRTRKDGGAGLGLSITKSIVEAHGGIIKATGHEGEGATLNVWIPE